MGGQSTQGSQTTSPPVIPPYLLPVLGQGQSELMQALTGGVPNLTQLYQNTPLQGVAPLTGQQNQDINSIQGLGQTQGAFPYEKQAAGNLGAIASPEAEKQGFEQFALPETMQNAALMGQGNSGAADYAVAQAAIPYQLQAQNTELAANQSLAGLGQFQSQNQQNELMNALQAAGLPQQEAQQILNSRFNQQEEQSQFAKSLQTFPLSLFGQTIGGGTSVSTAPKF